MECIDSCDDSSQVQITDPQLSSIPLCRSFTYYVNPLSSSPVELGTKLHPYKELDSVFVEILNFHSHSERTITVLVQEGATVFVNSPTYIVNMTGIIIDTYSRWKDTSGFARMVGIKNEAKIVPVSISTRFNILRNKNLEKQKQIFEKEGFHPNELLSVQVEDAVFKPYHAGLTIRNFRILTDYDDIATSHAFVSPTRVDAKSVSFINVDFKCQGTIMHAFTTGFNWYMENVSYETQNLFRLSLMSQECGESGSYLDTKTYFKNVTSYNSGDKPPELHIEQSNLRNNIIGDLHFEDVYIDSYIGYPVGVAQNLFFISHTNCMSEKERVYNFTNIEITTSRHEKNPEMNGTASFVLMPNYEGEVDLGQVHMSNITCSNDNFKRHDCIQILLPSSPLTLRNIQTLNTKGTVFNTSSKYATIKNIRFDGGVTENSPAFEVSARYALAIENVEIINSKFQNSQSDQTFYFDCSRECNASIRNITIDNVETVNTSGLLFYNGISNSNLTIQDIYVKNVVMSGNSAVIKYNMYSKMLLSTIHVINVTTKQNSFVVGSIISSFYDPLTDAYDIQQEISDIFIEQSSISMLSISDPGYSSTASKSLTLTNATYINSHFTEITEIVKFSDLISLGEYNIELKDLIFKNLSSDLSAYLMYLHQQLSSALVIRNIEVSEVSSMGITIEPSNISSEEVSTLVEIDNMTAFNIDGNRRSLLNINKGATVTISNSTFFNISNVDSGAVINAGRKQAVILVYDSHFYNNTSVEGGVFVTRSGSIIRCHRCLLTNNFAVDSGVIKVDSGGIFEFYDSEFYDNNAVISSVSTIFSAHVQSLFNNCTFSRNILTEGSEMLSEVIPNMIQHQTLKDHLLKHQYLYETKALQY